MDPTKKCISIETEGDLPIKSNFCSGLANVKDKFVILISNVGSHRYSLAEDKWEELPIIQQYRDLSACSLGDKVYVLDHAKRAIKVLHNPDAPVSSQKMHWQEIEVPRDIPIPRHYPHSHHSTRLKLSSQGVRMKKARLLETL